MDTLSQASAVSARARSDNRSDKKGVDGWINEGGHVTDLAAAQSGTSKASTAAPEQEALRESVRLIGQTLLADFTNGLVGEHHNTFQHRSRVLRQLTAKLRATTEYRA